MFLHLKRLPLTTVLAWPPFWELLQLKCSVSHFDDDEEDEEEDDDDDEDDDEEDDYEEEDDYDDDDD